MDSLAAPGLFHENEAAAMATYRDVDDVSFGEMIEVERLGLFDDPPALARHLGIDPGRVDEVLPRRQHLWWRSRSSSAKPFFVASAAIRPPEPTGPPAAVGPAALARAQIDIRAPPSAAGVHDAAPDAPEVSSPKPTLAEAVAQEFTATGEPAGTADGVAGFKGRAEKRYGHPISGTALKKYLRGERKRRRQNVK